MKKATKIWLITAVVLIVVGLGVFIGGMSMLHWDFSRLSNIKYTDQTFEISDSFEDLSISAKNDDVSLVLTDDKQCKVVCHEQEKMEHTVEVNNKTLKINVKDTREWYEHIGWFSFDSPKITVYLPKKSYHSLVINEQPSDIEIPESFQFGSIEISGSTGEVRCGASSAGVTSIAMSTGNIDLNGASARDFELSVTTGDIRLDSVSSEGDITIGISTGKIELNDVTCKNLTSDGSTGDVWLKNVLALKSMHIERSTGDVELSGCDADEIFIKTSTGDVTGTLLSDKTFITDTSTGDVSVPNSSTGGKCQITTSTGDIVIRIQKA